MHFNLIHETDSAWLIRQIPDSCQFHEKGPFRGVNFFLDGQGRRLLSHAASVGLGHTGPARVSTVDVLKRVAGILECKHRS